LTRKKDSRTRTAQPPRPSSITAPGREIDQLETFSRVDASWVSGSPGGRTFDRATRRRWVVDGRRKLRGTRPVDRGRLGPLQHRLGIRVRPQSQCLEVLSGLERYGEALLRNAAGHARDRQWAEAIDIYQRIIGGYGDKVAKLPRERGAEEAGDEFVLFVDLRGHCHRSLAKLPPEARAIYRNRVDGQAERWYREGERQRDPALLLRVVDQAFGSSWGDEALELLGDLAFQGGRFGEALASYRQLVLDRPEATFTLVHPDPSVDLARVAA